MQFKAADGPWVWLYPPPDRNFTALGNKLPSFPYLLSIDDHFYVEGRTRFRENPRLAP